MLEVTAETRDQILSGLEEMARFAEGPTTFTPVALPSAMGVKAIIGSGLWLYLRGPRDGYRRPMTIQSPETLLQVAELVAEISGSSPAQP